MSFDEQGAQLAATTATHRGPFSIYEVHLDSWMRVVEEENRPLTCAEIAPKLTEYARRLNFTHVGILSTSPPSPGDFMELVHRLTESSLGVVMVGPWSSHSEGNWDRDWAARILAYFTQDPLERQHHHRKLTTMPKNAGETDLILPLSHELVTKDKGSLLTRMPGDDWRKFANLRLLFALMFAMPGGKLLFMGGEFGQWNAWNPQGSLDWHLVKSCGYHTRMQNWVAQLNRVHRSEPCLHLSGNGARNFEWVDDADESGSTLALLRRETTGGGALLVVFNFTPTPRYNFRVGVPVAGFWQELLNSDATEYGGSGQGNLGGVEASPLGWHFKSHSLMVTLPPLGAVFFKSP